MKKIFKMIKNYFVKKDLESVESYVKDYMLKHHNVVIKSMEINKDGDNYIVNIIPDLQTSKKILESL